MAQLLEQIRLNIGSRFLLSHPAFHLLWLVIKLVHVCLVRSRIVILDLCVQCKGYFSSQQEAFKQSTQLQNKNVPCNGSKGQCLGLVKVPPMCPSALYSPASWIQGTFSLLSMGQNWEQITFSLMRVSRKWIQITLSLLGMGLNWIQSIPYQSLKCCHIPLSGESVLDIPVNQQIDI